MHSIFYFELLFITKPRRIFSFNGVPAEDENGTKFIVYMAFIDLNTYYTNSRAIESSAKALIRSIEYTTIQPPLVYGTRLQKFIYTIYRDVNVIDFFIQISFDLISIKHLILYFIQESIQTPTEFLLIKKEIQIQADVNLCLA